MKLYSARGDVLPPKTPTRTRNAQPRASSSLLSAVARAVEGEYDLSASHRLYAGLCCGFALLFSIALVFAHLLPEKSPFRIGFQLHFFNLVALLPPLVAGVTGYYYARHAPRTTSWYWGWVLFGFAGFSYFIGQSVWTYYELVLHIQTPFPSWGDLGFLSVQFSIIAGVFVLFSALPVVGRVRLLLDSAIAMTSLAALSWYLLIGKLWDQSNTSQLAKLLGIAYPMTDLIALYGACALFSSSIPRASSLRRSLGLLVCGIICLTFSDSTYNYLLLEGQYHTGHWLDWGWMAGWLLIANSIRLQLVQRDFSMPLDQLKHFSESPHITLWRLLTPYLAAGLAIFSIALYDISRNGDISLSIFGWGMALIVLVAMRQIFTVLENQNLAQQVGSLLQYTRELNDVLDVEHVLQVTARYAQCLTRSHAAAIWLNPRVPKTDVERSAAQRESFATDIEAEPPAPARLFRHSGEPQYVAALENLAEGSGLTSAFVPATLQIPLQHRNETLGTVAVLRAYAPFTDEEREVLEAIALEAGTSIANALSYRSAVDAADRDPVTGLFNHRAIHQHLRVEFEKAVQGSQHLSVVMIDMNDFKFFNDTYGHQVGDSVLQHVARVLSETCRPTDIVGRYGGDEFLLVLPDTSAHGGEVVAQRVKARMDAEGFRLPGGANTLPVPLALGVATYPDDARKRSDLLAAADINLYRAKHNHESIGITRDIQRSNNQLRSNNSFGFLETLVTAVDNKDSYTRQHSEDVTEFAIWLGEALELSPEQLRAIRIGGLLHDVGKIGVPDEILRKPGKLTDEEFENIKQHPVTGALIVAGVPGMEFIHEIVRYHHERWDGKGYPDGLKGEEIPLLGRIVAIADAFSAMTTTRPYRVGMEWETALAEIERCSGTQFDPIFAPLFVATARTRHQSQSTKTAS